MTDDTRILARLETYYDSVPRRRSDPEQHGPFTLFVARSGWPFYARPRFEPDHVGTATPATVADVQRVIDRQRGLGVPVAFEWVDESSPGLEAVVARAGLHVERCPLLVLQGDPPVDTSAARLLGPDDVNDLALSRAAISVGFEVGGTGVGTESIPERDAHVGTGFAMIDELVTAELASGRVRSAAAFDSDHPELGPIGGGSHTAVGDVTEVAGVAVLPAYRRRGLAGAITGVLAQDALDRGVKTVFCSAQSREVARVYERIGFRITATACIASLPGDGH